jgi:hypothetical protein
VRTAAAIVFLALARTSGGVLLSDDFSDGSADGWTEYPSGMSYSVVDGWYVFSGSMPEQALAASLNGDEGGGMSVPDYSLRVRLEAAEGEPGALARFSPFEFTGYAVILLASLNLVSIARLDGLSSDPVPIAIAYSDLEYGQQYWLRFELSGNLLGARVWTGDPGDEPTDWLVTAVDGSYSSPGAIGLMGISDEPGGTAALDVAFDEVEVVDDLTLPLESSSWASIKASAGE